MPVPFSDFLGPQVPYLRRESCSVAACEALPADLPSMLAWPGFDRFATSRCVAYAVKLSDMDQVAAGVIRLGDGRACHLGRRHLEFGAVFHPFVVALDVIREEHRPGLALLEERLLVGLDRGVVVALEMQLSAIRLFGRRHSEPAIPAVRNVRLLHEAGHFCVEAQGLVEVVHVNGCQLDLHWFPPVTFPASAASMDFSLGPPARDCFFVSDGSKPCRFPCRKGRLSFDEWVRPHKADPKGAEVAS